MIDSGWVCNVNENESENLDIHEQGGTVMRMKLQCRQATCTFGTLYYVLIIQESVGILLVFSNRNPGVRRLTSELYKMFRLCFGSDILLEFCE